MPTANPHMCFSVTLEVSPSFGLCYIRIYIVIHIIMSMYYYIYVQFIVY